MVHPQNHLTSAQCEGYKYPTENGAALLEDRQQLSSLQSSYLCQLWQAAAPAEVRTLENCSRDIKYYSRLLQSCCISDIPTILNFKHSFGRHVSPATFFPLHSCAQAWLSKQQLY